TCALPISSLHCPVSALRRHADDGVQSFCILEHSHGLPAEAVTDDKHPSRSNLGRYPFNHRRHIEESPVSHPCFEPAKRLRPRLANAAIVIGKDVPAMMLDVPGKALVEPSWNCGCRIDQDPRVRVTGLIGSGGKPIPVRCRHAAILGLTHWYYLVHAADCIGDDGMNYNAL